MTPRVIPAVNDAPLTPALSHKGRGGFLYSVYFAVTLKKCGRLYADTPSPLVGEGWGEGALSIAGCGNLPFSKRFIPPKTAAPHPKPVAHSAVVARQRYVPYRHRQCGLPQFFRKKWYSAR